MKNKLINYENIEFLKAHGGKVYIFGVRHGLLRDIYFDITLDMETGDIIEENIFKRFLEINPKDSGDKAYIEKREFLKGLP